MQGCGTSRYLKLNSPPHQPNSSMQKVLSSLGKRMGRGVLCSRGVRPRPRVVVPHLNQRWRQLSVEHAQWSDGYPETRFRRPLVTTQYPTTPLPLAIPLLFISTDDNLFTDSFYSSSSLSISICKFMAFSSSYSLSTPTPLHHLTRFSCFSHTWTHPTGSILHSHGLLEPEFVLTSNTKQSAISSTFSHHIHHCNPLDSSSDCTFVLMDNSYSPFPTTTTTTTTSDATTNFTTTMRQPNMGWSQNSVNSNNNFSSYYTPIAPVPPPNAHHFHHPSRFAAPNQSLQQQQQLPFSVAYPVYPPYNFSSINPSSNYGVQGSCYGQPKVVLDPNETKVARIKRKLARQSQRSLSLQRNNSLGASTQVTARRLTSSGAETSNADQYKFCTPDNKVHLETKQKMFHYL